jgi:hypothetical protein
MQPNTASQNLLCGVPFCSQMKGFHNPEIADKSHDRDLAKRLLSYPQALGGANEIKYC